MEHSLGLLRWQPLCANSFWQIGSVVWTMPFASETGEVGKAFITQLTPFCHTEVSVHLLCQSDCTESQREDLQRVFELEKWQRPPAQGVKHNSCHFIFFQWQYSGKQRWAHNAESLFPVSARRCFKIRWDALIWESQEQGPEEVKEEMLLALLELFTDQLLFSSFILLRNSYIVFAFCVQLSTSISLSASQRAINSVLQISLSSRWTLWLIVMQHISLRTINLY